MKNFTLEEVIKDNKLMLKCVEQNNSGVKIMLNNQVIDMKNCSLEEYLENLRNMLKNDIKSDFVFLDKEGNEVDVEGEVDFSIIEISDGDCVKIKSNSY